MRNYDFQSTGDPEQDRKIAAMIRKGEAMRDEGMCPNGCGPAEWSDPYTERCPVCGYYGGHNVPYGGRPELFGNASQGEEVERG